MNYKIEGDSLPVVLCSLSPGEVMVSQSGGRTWAKGSIRTETRGGGAKKMLGRMFSGESLFMSVYTAEEQCEIGFTSSFPGSILVKELRAGENLICQKTAFLCATGDVELSMFFNKKIGSGAFGGEGFIMQKVTGPGTVFLEVAGYCKGYTLNKDEVIKCDTGVLVAMDETCKLDVEMVKGVKNILFGGEGLIDTVVSGPGEVYLQSMTIPKIAALVAPYVQLK